MIDQFAGQIGLIVGNQGDAVLSGDIAGGDDDNLRPRQIAVEGDAFDTSPRNVAPNGNAVEQIRKGEIVDVKRPARNFLPPFFARDGFADEVVPGALVHRWFVLYNAQLSQGTVMRWFWNLKSGIREKALPDGRASASRSQNLLDAAMQTRNSKLETVAGQTLDLGSDVLQNQQSDRDGGQRIHRRMNLPSPPHHQIESDMGDEAPEDPLRDRECQRDQNDREKGRQPLFNLREGYLSNTAKHRRPHQDQYRSRGISWHHARYRRDKQAGQKAECGEDRGQPGATAHLHAGNALDVGGAGR